ncbi:MAG: PDZ domain-containing protein, partial [Paludibacter sp.]|nr:PDZ domain-containing protein [Paludibacter sp.]
MKKLLFTISFLIVAYSADGQQISTMQQKKLNDVLNAIGRSYVDSVDGTKLVEYAIKGMLRELDPHSAYIPREEVERVNEPLQGGFDGIGIQFQMFEDTLLVVQTIAGCPAEKVGVLPDDRIVYVGETLIAGVKMQNSDIMKLLRGRRGTEVEISVKRQGEKNLLKFNIIRDKIPIYSVDAHYLINNEIGYIKINSFGANTLKEFEDAFIDLKNKGMKSLILSLQSNGGGYLQSAF